MNIVHAFKKGAGLALSLGALSLLAGCYSAGVAVYGDWGSRVDVAPHVTCLNISEGTLAATGYTVTEIQNPRNSLLAQYEAVQDGVGDKNTYVFAPAKGAGMFVVQKRTASGDSGSVYYGWYNENSQTFFDENSISDAAQVVADFTGVSISAGSLGSTISIDGEPEEIRTFLEKLAPYVHAGQVCLRG